MGIFSRLFGGGQDGEPPDEPGDGAVEATDAAPEHVESSKETESPVRFAPAGSEPTSLPKIEPNMWAWPGTIPARTPPPPLPPAPEPEPLDVKAEPKPTKPASGRIPKLPALIVDSSRTATPVIEATTKPRDPTTVSSPPPPTAIEATTKPRDPTLVSAPPPAAPVSASPPRASPPPPKRGKPDTINSAFDSMIAAGAREPVDGVSTAADLAEVRRTFEQVVAVHVGQVRDVMLELTFGAANPAWLETAKPALQSVRKMAAQMELADLVAALDAFCTALDTAIRTGVDDKAGLLRVYERLIALVPNAFELSAEHDRREPIIVEALLLQIDGVERTTIERLASVGLGKLDALLSANAADLVAVTGMRTELAQAIAARFATYRAAGSTLAALDIAAERKQLHDLVIVLSLNNDEFRRVAASWQPEDLAKKRALRKLREQTFHKIRVVLARLGEREHLNHLDKLAFDDRIAMLDKLISTHLAG